MNRRAGKALIEAVKNQIKDTDPPETQQTYQRLLDQGILEEDVYIYLARALAGEIDDMMREGRSYNKERYVKRLARLPND